MSDVWPTEIKIREGGRMLTIRFDDGAAYDLPAEFLRVMSPSAEVQGHSPDERKIIGGKQDVTIVDAQTMGNYAIKLAYSDDHSTGLYTWSYLAELGRGFDEKWADYLADLEAVGLTRARPGQAGAPKHRH